MAATVDCLFAYDATAHVLSDYQYELVAEAYVNDEASRAFLQRHNPDALREICERPVVPAMTIAAHRSFDPQALAKLRYGCW